MTDHTDQIERQRASFNAKAQYYTAHHSDPANQAYRDEFFRNRLLSFDLAGKRVLDAMCAGGPDAHYFMARGATDIVGLDISPVAASLYRDRTGLPCQVGSMHATGLPSSSFDVVWICGGLHHIFPLLPDSLAEIHRLLRPGGYFVDFEPNADTWVDSLRVLYYRMSNNFDDSEQAIDYRKHMRPLLSLGFEEEIFFTGGNVAYLLVFNSGVFRIPLSAKRRLSPVFTWLERWLSPLPGVPHLSWGARWRKSAQPINVVAADPL